MAIHDFFSKRQRRARGELPDVYQYDRIPETLRAQIAHIWRTALVFAGTTDELWSGIHDAVARERGVFSLGQRGNSHVDQCLQFLMTGTTVDVLDIVECSFGVLASSDGYWLRRQRGATQPPEDALAELNMRFKEHGVGYQFESGIVVRIDSQFIHNEVIRPALSILSNRDFAGAQEEFLKGHEHYRHGRYKEAVAEALKSFESVMKAIAAKRRWTVDANAPAKKLIECMLQNGLIPQALQSELTALVTVLESGLPTVRNKTSGHGQGAAPVQLPSHVAAYALHLAAAKHCPSRRI